MEQQNSLENLRRAYEELARRVFADRLGFADRVQEVLDDVDRLQAGIDDRDAQIRALTTDAEALRERVASLNSELIEAHEALRKSSFYRYTAPLRRLADVFRRT